MKIEELYTLAANAATSGRLVKFNLNVYPPNSRAIVSLTGTSSIFMDEDPGDDEQAKQPWDWPHRLTNYYYLRKRGEKGWDFIGESKDWLNMWEIECPVTKFRGPGSYIIRAIMAGEVEGKLLFAEKAVLFDVERADFTNSPLLEDGAYPCSATLYVNDGKAIVVLNSTFGLPFGTTIPLRRTEHNIKVEDFQVDSNVIKNGHTII